MVSRKMKTTPAVTCIKIFLGLFTSILWIIGLCIFGTGIYSKTMLGGYDLLTTSNYSIAPYIMIGIGIFVVIVSFFGCCAIWKENICMLRTFAVFLGVLFLAEIIFSLVVVVERSKIEAGFIQGMSEAIANYNNDKAYENAVDNAQIVLKCCGAYNYADYWVNGTFDNNTCPISCCRSKDVCQNISKENVVDLSGSDIDKIIYNNSCPEKVFNTVNANLGIILGALFGVAGFQLIGLILACCLAATINSNKYELV